ncbi:MAG: hypothetical protein JXP72_08485 [Coriobacteriia bacterium]|nr:hypothetical protein [Coriobacteriia bacterium]
MDASTQAALLTGGIGVVAWVVVGMSWALGLKRMATLPPETHRARAYSLARRSALAMVLILAGVCIVALLPLLADESLPAYVVRDGVIVLLVTFVLSALSFYGTLMWSTSRMLRRWDAPGERAPS